MIYELLCHGRCGNLTVHLVSVYADGALGWTGLGVGGVFNVHKARTLGTTGALSSQPHDGFLAQTCRRNTLLK